MNFLKSTAEIKTSLYQCIRCKYKKEITRVTEDNNNMYSWDRYNTCPNCPPSAKYPEFGGGTIWVFQNNIK